MANWNFIGCSSIKYFYFTFKTTFCDISQKGCSHGLVVKATDPYIIASKGKQVRILYEIVPLVYVNATYLLSCMTCCIDKINLINNGTLQPKSHSKPVIHSNTFLAQQWG